MIKLGGQLIAVWALFKAGISVQIIWLPEWVNLLITVLWIMGVTNAFNLIDIMDGLSSGVALIACVFLAIISFINGNYLIAAFTFTLGGSLLGFLPHNFKPARIYLGDTGSMAIGFILAALTINEQYTVNGHWIGVLAPVVIMGIPIFETGFLIIVRLAKGKHPLRGSPDHFALRLRRMGMSVERTVMITYTVGIMMGGLGLAIVFADDLSAMTALGLYFLFCIAAAIFLLLEEILGSRKKARLDGKH
jgi:UDP-GlcNAc:undecaprenyl-phosphate GlcNAc-1-phosphate transferase